MLNLHSLPIPKLTAICSSAEIVDIQTQLDMVYCSDELKGYIIDIARESRQNSALLLGASPRAAINLMKAARAHALLNGREFVTHDDVQSICHSVLGHRLIMRPEAEMDGRTIDSVIQQVIQRVPVLADTKQ